MARIVKELSVRDVQRLVADRMSGYHRVGGVPGLCLQVGKEPSNRCSWVLRCRVGNRRRDIGLGGYPAVSLASARERARRMKDEIWEGIDPIEKRKAAWAALKAEEAKFMRFDDCVQEYLKAQVAYMKNYKHRRQWESTLATYASPIIGKLNVADIELAHIIKILEPLWTTKPETAGRLRGRIEKVLAWATVRGFRQGDNPARWKGHLDHVFAAPSKIRTVKHHRALPVDELPEFMAALSQLQGQGARALEFTILTAARSGEVRGMSWDEIDLGAAVWAVPASRMKTGREHRVPLSAAAVTALARADQCKDCDLVFPGKQGRPLSDMTLSAVLKRMKVDATVHGFRSTFRDWCAEETATPSDVAEMALSHTIRSKVEAAYRRGDLLEKRHMLMEQWAAFAGWPESRPKVVKISA